jgi:hypothetical protein
MAPSIEDETTTIRTGYEGNAVCAADLERKVTPKIDDQSLQEASGVTLSADERAAKLADLRAQKAKLLEAKAQAAKLVEEKQRQARLAYLEDGKQRGLKGFALVEHAAKLAEPAKQQNGKLDQMSKEESGTIVNESQVRGESQDEARGNGTENHTREDHEEQPDESFRRQQDAKFVAAQPQKLKSDNRKGHRTRHTQQRK